MNFQSDILSRPLMSKSSHCKILNYIFLTLRINAKSFKTKNIFYVNNLNFKIKIGIKFTFSGFYFDLYNLEQNFFVFTITYPMTLSDIFKPKS